MVYTKRGPQNNRWKITAACLAAFLHCALVGAADFQDAAEATKARVRSTDARILDLLVEGRDRSAAFKEVVAAVEKSAGIVYVEFGFCAFGHLNGCLLPFIARVGGERYLRIVVSPDRNQRTHDELLAVIAHELQHAREVLEHEGVVDAPTMTEMFKKIGAPVKHGYETAAAQAMGDQVLSELSNQARRVARP